MSTNSNSPRHSRGVPAGNTSPADPWAAAREGALPSGFDGWTLADERGRTVAHTAAFHGHLPAGFDRWDLADKDGWTVAHAAAAYGRPLVGFGHWDLADRGGRSVAQVVLERASSVGGSRP